ncbi:MAG: deoxyhypusine synthase [Candidatus Aenigmarchaeota archaeon]|nr:deoxyhypusine synthase [Candidatus Aenigmarchaeota archaeon]MCX8190635.1 deoxyhypusine synthase [Candidatus Aenigmarchaeota archaeon]MDW8159803.1 deoxyhypusine synthase [Candidatus Aenigmarchaeota archaeon]
MDEVKDLDLSEEDTIETIVKKMEKMGGFQGRYFSEAAAILEEMINSKEVLKFLSFPACIISTGLRGVIKEMVKRKWFDVVITTCGTLDHDIARSFEKYVKGDFFSDDVELHKKDIHRLGNVFIPKKSYGLIIEKKMKEWLPEIYKTKKELSTYEFCWEIGKRLNESSILFWCEKNKIPMLVPGITDGAVGYQLWEFWQERKDFKIDLLKDEQLLSDLVWSAKKSGALIIGGGISKHHVIWWNQFKGGLDYVVYITTAVEWDGSLSGAQTKEAISWGKVKERSKNVTLYSDVTIVLPFLFYYILKRLES